MSVFVVELLMLGDEVIAHLLEFVVLFIEGEEQRADVLLLEALVDMQGAGLE